jgi:hypothetical protein
MQRTCWFTAAVMTAALVLLVFLACAGSLASARGTGQSPAAQSSSPQRAAAPAVSAPAAPTASAPAPAASTPEPPPAAPAEPIALPGVEAELNAAAPMLQFAISSGTIDFGGSLTPGTYTQSLTAVVNSNQTWRISVTKSGDLTGASGSIPSSYFTFGAVGPAGKTTYQAPAGTEFGTDTLVVAGNRGANLATTITYRLSVPWTIAPDSYSTAHTYTAVQI